ncbi:MAG: FitA-like ribbon-helix-helix domain-containing protein [Tepidiformaceae bacterium]
MPNILVRDVDAETADYWKRRARLKGRSVQAELADYLRDAALAALAEREAAHRDFWAWADAFRAEIGPDLTDSAILRHEGRRE